jgi:hypothetical protein
LEVVEARLQRLGGYEMGWDGYGGRAPRDTVIEFVRSILNSVMKPTAPAPAIVPLSGGGLQVEWHTKGLDIELSVFAPFDVELTAVFPDGREPIEDEPLTADLDELGYLLAELA